MVKHLASCDVKLYEGFKIDELAACGLELEACCLGLEACGLKLDALCLGLAACGLKLYSLGA